MMIPDRPDAGLLTDRLWRPYSTHAPVAMRETCRRCRGEGMVTTAIWISKPREPQP